MLETPNWIFLTWVEKNINFIVLECCNTYDMFFFFLSFLLVKNQNISDKNSNNLFDQRCRFHPCMPCLRNPRRHFRKTRDFSIKHSYSFLHLHFFCSNSCNFSRYTLLLAGQSTGLKINNNKSSFIYKKNHFRGIIKRFFFN